MEWITDNWQTSLLAIAVPILAFVGHQIGWYRRTRWAKQQIEDERLYSERRLNEERLYAERRKLYMQLVEPFIMMFAGTSDDFGSDERTLKIIDKLQSPEHMKMMHEFLYLGTDEVVYALNDLWRLIYSMDNEKLRQTDSTQTGMKVIEALGALHLAIRRELGNPDTELTKIDMFVHKIKGIEEYTNQIKL